MATKYESIKNENTSLIAESFEKAFELYLAGESREFEKRPQMLVVIGDKEGNIYD